MHSSSNYHIGAALIAAFMMRCKEEVPLVTFAVHIERCTGEDGDSVSVEH